MNIIKLQDIIMSEDIIFKDLFNKCLKGKYAYWVQMRYIFPLSPSIGDSEEDQKDPDYELKRYHLSQLEYCEYEQQNEEFFKQFSEGDNIRCIDIKNPNIYIGKWTEKYVDDQVTDSINNIQAYIDSNSYTTDEYITLGEIKNFSSWLAESLLIYKQSANFDDDTVHMLEYYKNYKYDDVVKYLTSFDQSQAILESSNSNKCHCCNPIVTYDITLNNIHTCDVVEIYRTNVYKKMVDVFSEVSFWVQFNKLNNPNDNLIYDFKHYIDNIIHCRLNIRTMDTYEDYKDCQCNGMIYYDADMKILNRLSKALEYIYEGSQDQHKNDIYNALNDWASLLYEHMYFLNIKQ